jgi:hypothetical protein
MDEMDGMDAAGKGSLRGVLATRQPVLGRPAYFDFLNEQVAFHPS